MTTAHKMDPLALAHVIRSNKQNSGAEFTVRSKKTGKDFTYKISRAEWKGRFYTHVKVEKEYQKYTYLGYYDSGMIVRKHDSVETPSAVAIAWLLRQVEHTNKPALDGVEIFHLGKCVRCGAVLTDATSIEIGLGPVCRGHE